MSNNASVVSDDAMRYVIKRIKNKGEKEVKRVCQMTDDLFSYPHGSTATLFGMTVGESRNKRKSILA